MMILTFSDAYDFNQLSCGLCQLLPQFYAEPSLAEAPLGVCMHPNLKRPQFCYLGRHCFGKDPPCYSYLLQVINPSFFHPGLVVSFAQHPSRGKPGFGVTLGQSFDQNSYSSLLKLKAAEIEVLQPQVMECLEL